MLDRPALEATVSGAPRRAVPRWPLAFVGFAGLLGASGVVVGAAGAHLAGRGAAGGADLARTASEFLLVHAAAVLAGAAAAPALRRGSALSAVLLAAALRLLALGAALFGGELAVAALADWRPLPLAAPTGGLCLIAGWLCLSGAALAAAFGRSTAAR